MSRGVEARSRTANAASLAIRSTVQTFSRMMGGAERSVIRTSVQRFRSGVVDDEAVDDRDVVLCRREIDPVGSLVGDGHRLWGRPPAPAGRRCCCRWPSLPSYTPAWRRRPTGSESGSETIDGGGAWASVGVRRAHLEPSARSCTYPGARELYRWESQRHSAHVNPPGLVVPRRALKHLSSQHRLSGLPPLRGSCAPTAADSPVRAAIDPPSSNSLSSPRSTDAAASFARLLHVPPPS